MATIQPLDQNTAPEASRPLLDGVQKKLGMVPNLRGFPTTLFFGRDGTLRTRIVGYHELAVLEADVKKLIVEEAPKKKASKKSGAKKSAK